MSQSLIILLRNEPLASSVALCDVSLAGQSLFICYNSGYMIFKYTYLKLVYCLLQFVLPSIAIIIILILKTKMLFKQVFKHPKLP